MPKLSFSTFNYSLPTILRKVNGSKHHQNKNDVEKEKKERRKKIKREELEKKMPEAVGGQLKFTCPRYSDVQDRDNHEYSAQNDFVFA